MNIFKHRKPSSDQREKIYLSFVDKVFGLCRRYASDDQQAMDFTQDCFIEIFDKIGHYNPDKGELGGWIYVVSRNHVLKKLKRSNRLKTVDLGKVEFALGEEDDDEKMEYEERSERVLKAIQTLPEGYKLVVNLYVFEERSHKEIAEILGISASTSRSQLTRAKKQLKKRLEKEHELSR